ncbi:MAG: ATP-binding protein [Spirochaetia bacterium]|nr:ATP-binding protein [Spirochaetia bacterium]
MVQPGGTAVQSDLYAQSNFFDGSHASILVITDNLKTAEYVKSSLINIEIQLFFAENRNHALVIIEENPDIKLILFDVSNFTDEKLNNIHDHVSDEYFSPGGIPAILIVTTDQTEKILDLFSENVIDFFIFPIQIIDFISKIKLHISMLLANREIKELAVQLRTILEGTRNIAKTRDPLTAATVACSFILKLCGNQDAKLDMIYLPPSSFHNNANFHSHRPIDGFNLLTEPYKERVNEFEGNPLSEISSPKFINHKLLLPVINEHEILAILQFNNFPQNIFKSKKFDPILSMVDSLSIVLKNFLNEDHSRLANIGQMAASIIHDLKNYTVVIRNSAKLALDDSLSSEQKSQFLNNISYESERMMEMTHDILDFSKGGLSISTISVETDQFTKRLRQFLDPLCEERNTILKVMNHVQGSVFIDPDRVLRAIFNIAVNACDAMEKKDPENRILTLNISKSGNLLKIDLQDTGKGIPSEIKNSIFEPFISHKKNGTGLGMAIARSIIEAHGGTIDFQTEKDNGTVFYLKIPQKIIPS